MYLACVERVPLKENESPVMPEAPVVSIQSLEKSFHEGSKQRTVLAGLDLVLQRGEFVVLLGRSGTGKSTLLNLISGIDQPTAGTVSINGIEINGMSELDRTLFRREHIGFVFQSFNLIPTLTVLENVLLPSELRGAPMEETTGKAKALLEKVGLGDRQRSFPDVLSGGEQQRVAIIRAIVHDPALILADEPTGNLDDDTAEQVLALFEEMVRNRDKATLVVTHDRSMVERADRVLELKGGKLAEWSGEGTTRGRL